MFQWAKSNDVLGSVNRGNPWGSQGQTSSSHRNGMLGPPESEARDVGRKSAWLLPARSVTEAFVNQQFAVGKQVAEPVLHGARHQLVVVAPNQEYGR